MRPSVHVPWWRGSLPFLQSLGTELGGDNGGENAAAAVAHQACRIIMLKSEYGKVTAPRG